MCLFCALIDRTSIDRVIETSTTKADPFPGVVRVISTGLYEGALLLNKKTMFPLKEHKLPGALKLLLFKVYIYFTFTLLILD